MEAVQKTLRSPVVRQTQTQSLNAIVSGFGFAAAIAWMDVVRAMVARVGSQAGLKANGASQSVLIALLTTLLSVLVVAGLNRSGAGQFAAGAPVYAVTA